MTREELAQLRDALSATLALPDSVRTMLAQWLSAEPSKPNGVDAKPGNGLDRHPAPIAPTPRPARTSAVRSTRGARSAERKLLAALQEHPDQSAGALARASGDALTTTKTRLKRLSARGAIERGPAGWRLKGAEASTRVQPRPTQPPPATS
jgi:hypothetical protein